jgi:putative transposase
LFRPRKRQAIKTTDSNHSYLLYANLIKNRAIQRPEEVWVADITGIRINGAYSFLAIISDAYSRKIMGWRLGTHNTAELAGKALLEAWDNRVYTDLSSIIHHSDRGKQYCGAYYRNLLHQMKMTISTTETGDPRENAIAERIFRTLKREYGLNKNFQSFNLALRRIDQVIALYNHSRIHASCGFKTPAVKHIDHKKSPFLV